MKKLSHDRLSSITDSKQVPSEYEAEGIITQLCTFNETYIGTFHKRRTVRFMFKG